MLGKVFQLAFLLGKISFTCDQSQLKPLFVGKFELFVEFFGFGIDHYSDSLSTQCSSHLQVIGQPVFFEMMQASAT